MTKRNMDGERRYEASTITGKKLKETRALANSDKDSNEQADPGNDDPASKNTCETPTSTTPLEERKTKS
jgi:hypothetical protein